MDWDKLRIFHAAAEAGSFTHAGDSLHMSQSAVSRQVSALERDLKVVLFPRHARGLVLTEQGELLHRTTSDVINKLHTAETLLSDTTSKPTGELRITAPVGFGTMWLTQRLPEFHELYPEIRIELIHRPQRVLVHRREAQVLCELLEEPQDVLLRALLAGQPLGAACRELADRSSASGPELPVAAWFARWARQGLITGCA